MKIGSEASTADTNAGDSPLAMPPIQHLTGHLVVDAIEAIHITGMVVPRTWIHNLRTAGGKPDIVAALVLSEVVFWYRPKVTKAAGGMPAYTVRFKADKLQKSYSQLADALGFTKRQCQEAVARLRTAGLVTVEQRTLRMRQGPVLTNVTFLEPVPEAIHKLNRMPLQPRSAVNRMSRRNVTPITQKRETNIHSAQTQRSDKTLSISLKGDCPDGLTCLKGVLE